ncbi:MATE family efflux transporter [Flavivirga aquimarina]|uniref:Multidrug-efflux transporter n=1 Tax=Flavivirga aquimarina TaxID=2027862 RepID=A0ABT8WC37_9FLAO|nr:MATE family efflux transporter [Flavivirga aquimarina]MDO5970709.1 MATE family efflux transporter [Flavivirga aquimarina]
MSIILRLKNYTNLIKGAFLGKEKNLLTGNINRAIVILAIPTALEMLMESLFVCFNLFFVSKLGTNAIYIVGITGTIIQFGFSIAVGLGIAATSIISRRIGEKENRKAGLATMQILYIGFVASILLSLIGVVFYKQILLLVGLPEELLIEAKWFTRIMFISLIFLILRVSINGILRGAGNAAIAMRAIFISNIINIVLSPILIFGWGLIPEFGLLGLALAALIARISGLLYQCWALIKGKTVIIIGKNELKLSIDIIKKIFKIGMNGTLQYLVPASSWILMAKIISYLGADVFAGYIIAQRITYLAIMPAWGIGNAAGILTGQNLGANQFDRAEKSVWKAGFYNVCFLCFLTLLLNLNAESMVRFFSKDPEVIKNGILYLNYILIAYVLLGYTMVISRALNAAGDVKAVTLLYVIMFYIIQIPLAYLLGINLDYGSKGIFIAILISELILSTMCIIVFKRGKWKHIKI